MIGRIMIIDDAPVDRKIIRQLLEKGLDNIAVFEADNGLRVLEQLIKNEIDVCILDLMLPEKDGFQILKELKDDPASRDIPVIIYTGIEDSQTLEKALSLGAYEYFSKPLSAEVMKTALPLKVKNALELRKQSREASYLSGHDELTGLYNRRFFDEEKKRQDREGQLPLTIITGDINGLKLINDTFGHEKGDELLRQTAAVIKRVCRAQDVIARWGGDEFIMLFPQTPKEAAEHIVERMQKYYHELQVKGIEVTITFGWETKESAGQDIENILKKAEDHMYRNKTLESQSIRSHMIETIIRTLHEKNPREEAHSKRVRKISHQIGKAMGLSQTELNKLKVTSLLHDIGKIGIEESILNKPAALTPQEWEEIKRHPEIGFRIVSSSFEMLELAQCILAHHERWDGNGYPKGLKGEAIPLISRIIAVADAYDAMTSERPYREKLRPAEAIAEICHNAAKQFDPAIARIFVEKVLQQAWV